MNKKTFTLAVIFLCVTVVWLGANIYGLLAGYDCIGFLDLIIAVLFVAAGIAMVCNEKHKKRRRHLAEVDRNRIP